MNFEKSIQLLDKAVDIEPKDPNVYFERAWTKGRFMFGIKETIAFEGRQDDDLDDELYNEAISDFNRAIDLDSNFAKAYYFRGRTHMYYGQSAKACSDWVVAFEKGYDAQETIKLHCH